MTDNCKLRCAVYSDLSYVLPSAAKQTDSHSTRSVSDSEAESCRRPAAQKATGQGTAPTAAAFRVLLCSWRSNNDLLHMGSVNRQQFTGRASGAPARPQGAMS